MSSLTLSPESEALCLQKKNEGNEAMKRGDFSLAIALYSEAISIDPSNMMLFNNRAQAFLKLSSFASAEEDSSVVIASNPRLPNLKALFRRALARKGMATKSSLQEGLRDLNAILNAEPANKEAKLERGKLQGMLNEILAREEKEEKERREREERERMKMMPSSVERIVDDSGIVARSTVLRKNKAQPPSPGPQGQPLEMTEVATSPKKGAMGTGTTTAPTAATTPVTPSSASSASARSPASAPSSLSKEPKRITLSAPPPVPSEPPKTVYELERVLEGLTKVPKFEIL
jgi:hypothetical protein